MIICDCYMVISSFMYVMFVFFFFKQKTAYEMRISDWSSDVCSSDLPAAAHVECGVIVTPVAVDDGQTMREHLGGAAQETQRRQRLVIGRRLVEVAVVDCRHGTSLPSRRGQASPDCTPAATAAPGFPADSGDFEAETVGQRLELGSASCGERVCQYV